MAALIRQARLREAAGDDPQGWTVDLRRGRLRLGQRELAAEPIGTEAYSNDTFVWAWGNPGMEGIATPAALAVRAVGEERRIEELLDDFEIPLDRLDAFVASVLTVGIAGLDAYLLAPYEEEGSGVLALGIRDARLLAGAPHAMSIVSAFTDMLMGTPPPFSHRRAFAHYLAAPLAAVPAEVRGGSVVLQAADGPVLVKLDREGRIAEAKAEVPGSGGSY